MEALDGRKLRMQIIQRRPDPTVAAGHICSQHPYADSKVLSHSAVNVVLSAGPPRITVPPCAAVMLQEYGTTLTGQKLKLGAVTYAPHESACGPDYRLRAEEQRRRGGGGAPACATVAEKIHPTKEIP